ncbi:MAG TPA: CHAP domain-containing protein [Actinomycetota bacterium]|jgi:surface antigen|nr:CHAP domain-containing protein [Actinomycetota bacterium]
MRTRKLRLVTALVVASAASIALLASPAHAGDDYPYAGHDPSELDSRGFYYRHCTSFVAWRLSRRGPFDNYMNGGHWYHARNWAGNARRLGFAVDSTPAVGAVAHWYPGEGDADELGHVAIVQSVNADGSVYVEEYNGYEPYVYARRGPLRAARYIHIYDAAPSPASIATIPATTVTIPATTEVAPPAVRRSEPERRPAAADPGPVGHLTSPATRTPLRAGDRVTVGGTFTDDTGVAKVHFFAADENYKWTLVGTDARGGNGAYSVEWTVDYPAGSVVSLYAEAFDADGNPAVDSIRGLEGIPVARRSTSSAPVALAAHASRSSPERGRAGAYIAAVVVGFFALNGGVVLVRRRRRLHAIRLAWRRSAA